MQNVGNTSCTSCGVGDVDLHRDYGMTIHPHWDGYKDVIDSANDWLFYGIGTYITLVSIVSVLANSIVIFATFRTESLKKPGNILIIDLALSDMAFSLVCGFPLMTLSAFHRKWLWGDIGCQWYAFSAAFAGLNSINCLTSIAIDRFLVIVHQRSNCQAMVMVMVSLIWALLWASLPVIGWGQYIGEGFMISCTWDYLTRTSANIAYNYCLMTSEFVIPVGIIIYCYTRITISASRYVTKHTQSNRSSFQDIQQHCKGCHSHTREYKLAKILAGMILLFCVSWLPYAIVSQLGISGLQEYVNPYAAEFPVMLAKASAVWNPVVYALTQARYKTVVGRLLPGFFRQLFFRRKKRSPMLRRHFVLRSAVQSQSG